MTLRWKERTRRTPRQILLPRVQTTAVTPATLSLLWESTGETIRYWLSMPSPRRDRCKVPVSWGSVGPLQVLVYLAKVVTPVPVYLARVVTVAKALKLPEATHRGRPVEAVGGLSDRVRGPEPTGNNRNPNAPGVVATSGGSSQSTTLADTGGNVGVFGQGGDWVDETKNDGTHTDFIVGSSFAGAGVVGRGGVHMKNSQANGAVVRATDGAGAPEPGSAGIVGIAGGLTMPQPEAYFNAGVFGQSGTGHGVSGLSTNGIGVNGVSTTNAGVSGTNLVNRRIPTTSPFSVHAAGVFGFAPE